MSVLCCITFHLLCKITSYSVVDTAFGASLIMGMLAVVPGVSQVLFSPGHQCRSTEVKSQVCSNHGSGPAVGAMGAAQTLTWPNPHVYMPTKSTAAKARPISVAGALIVCLDVPQVLSLPSWSWGFNQQFVQLQGEISALLP